MIGQRGGSAPAARGGNKTGVNEVRVETSVKHPHNSPASKPLLAPLGRSTGWSGRIRETMERLPPAAAPVAFTLAGGIAIVAVLVSVLAPDPARDDGTRQALAAPEEAVAEAPAETLPEAREEPDVTVAGTQEQAASAAAGLEAFPEPDFDPAPWAIDPVAAGEQTASIPPAAPGGIFVPVVAVAETAAEVEALEAIQRQEVAEDIGEPSFEETSAIAPAGGQRVPATTTKWVNMRAGPSDDAEVLEVVPALAAIEAQSGCDWCAVSHEGREGYIYKTFLSYGDAADE